MKQHETTVNVSDDVKEEPVNLPPYGLLRKTCRRRHHGQCKAATVTRRLSKQGTRIFGNDSILMLKRKLCQSVEMPEVCKEQKISVYHHEKPKRIRNEGTQRSPMRAFD